ncbi:MAG TPA: pyridoxal phosphate-dependent aminotransferase [Roseiflexaceae bacterium]|nr:pyridoxal phosphate-dependent aminotransferase [Roseiflexaceae bacterium]
MTNESPLLAGVANRISRETLSFRSKMLALAASLPDVIAMGRGDPDFNTPAHICEAAKRAIDANQHHYTLPAGLVELREAIADTLCRDNDLHYSASEIIVTAGVQESLMLCMLALVNAGDEVLIPSPRFTSYDDAIVLCGGVPVPVPTYQEDDFALMPAEIEKLITPRSKVLALVTPNNPTGAVTPPAVIREIAALAERHNLIVISDEIYSKIIFEGSEHLSFGSLPGMKARTITLNGFSKSYAMTGWRVGYMAAPEVFTQLLIEPRHTLSVNANTPAQWAALAALTGPQDAVAAMVAAYTERRAFMMQALDAMDISYGHPGGAFYVYANIQRFGMPAPAFCETLLRETGVFVLPGDMFGDTSGNYVRFGLLQPLDRIAEAVERMQTFVASR